MDLNRLCKLVGLAEREESEVLALALEESEASGLEELESVPESRMRKRLLSQRHKPHT